MPGCLRAGESTVKMAKEQILDSWWSEYRKERYNDARDEQFDVEYNNEGPLILKMEVHRAIKICNLARPLAQTISQLNTTKLI